MGTKKRHDGSKQHGEKSPKRDNSKPTVNGKPCDDNKQTSSSSGSSMLIFTVALLGLSTAAALAYAYTNNMGDIQSIAVDLRKGIENSFTAIFQSTRPKEFSENKSGNKEQPNDPNRDSEKKTEDKPKPKKKKAYAKKSITNKEDNKIRGDLDEGDQLLKKDPSKSLQKFNSILKVHPHSPRALYGRAVALVEVADVQKSNKLLEEGIEQYHKVIDAPNIPWDLYKMTVNKCREKMQFRGWNGKALKLMLRAVEDYPTDNKFRNDLGVTYLMLGKNDAARDTFKEVLIRDPENGYALVHLGFILKVTDLNEEEAVKYLARGISSGHEGTGDGRFYFHLGDALQRLDRKNEAMKWYEEGASKGLFKSKWQRSLYNVNSLTSRPWWTKEQTTYNKQLKMLEDNWKTIRDEGLAQMDVSKGSFIPEEENLRETGDWKQFTLYQQGRKNEQNCKKVPKTCQLIDKIPDAWGCKRGQVKYSIMHPGVHVWPHCGPTNCRIRAHLGLVVPPGLKIRVAEETGTWTEGKFIIFDDSFEHEVWHQGESFRLVLIVDFWHPELTREQKRTLTPI